MSYGTEDMEQTMAVILGRPKPPHVMIPMPDRCKVCDLEILPPQKYGKIIITGWQLYVCECCVRTLHSSLCEVGK